MFKERVAELRPAYLPVDPANRTTYMAGDIAQCDLWFPPIEPPVGFGQVRRPVQLPVLTMATGYSRWLSAILIPTRRAEDLFAGWWRLIEALGAVPRTLEACHLGVLVIRSKVEVHSALGLIERDKVQPRRAIRLRADLELVSGGVDDNPTKIVGPPLPQGRRSRGVHHHLFPFQGHRANLVLPGLEGTGILSGTTRSSTTSCSGRCAATRAQHQAAAGTEVAGCEGQSSVPWPPDPLPPPPPLPDPLSPPAV